MELFTRVICHKNVIQSKIATMKKLALELFGNSYIGFEVCPYWKESDFLWWRQVSRGGALHCVRFVNSHQKLREIMARWMFGP